MKARKRSSLPTASHAVVESLIAERPGISRYRLGEELAKRWPDALELRDIARTIVPDAFEFHDDLRILTIIEVIDTHSISDVKAAKISDLSLSLEDSTDEEWNLSVAAFDKFGNLICELPGSAFWRGHIGLRPARDILPRAMASFEQRSAS